MLNLPPTTQAIELMNAFGEEAKSHILPSDPSLFFPKVLFTQAQLLGRHLPEMPTQQLQFLAS